jgi:hypothetical protein
VNLDAGGTQGKEALGILAEVEDVLLGVEGTEFGLVKIVFTHCIENNRKKCSIWK